MKVNLYDFDGVLASPLEEALFTMPETDKDEAFIKKAERLWSIDFSQESRRSQRYTAIQAAMLDMEMPITKGPIFNQLESPFYILTARCDRFAVKRCHMAIERWGIKPVKILHLDHLPKGQMIKVLLERHPDIHFEFWDDNPAHIESANRLTSNRLVTNLVDNDMRLFYKAASTLYRDQLLARVL